MTIQKFYSGLQALALGDDEQEEVEDCLKPDAEGMSYDDLVTRVAQITAAVDVPGRLRATQPRMLR